MSAEEQQACQSKIYNRVDALELLARFNISLIKTTDIANVNLRVVVDAFFSLCLISQTRYEEEMRKAVQVSTETEGVGVVVNYIEVRPWRRSENLILVKSG